MSKYIQSGLVARIAGAVALAAASLGAQAATVDLAGQNGTGYSAMIGFKGSTSKAAADAWNYAYYQDANGIYRAITATPLSTDSDYSAYLPAGAVVQGKDVTSADFATMSAGSISYDESVLTGVGVETIGVGALTLSINSKGFSPFYNGYNTGSGFGDHPWNYNITASGLAGSGLTFTNGVLTSIDLDAALSITIRAGESAFYVYNLGGPATVPAVLSGSLSISGDSYAFNVRDTGTYAFALQPSGLTLNYVINRAGDISAVTAVPEPGTYALMAAGLAVMGLFARKRRLG